MGNDFLDKTKGTFEKGWDQGYQDLARRDLFTTSPESMRTIIVKPVNGSAFSQSDVYELRQNQDHISVYRDGHMVGVCERPGQFVLNSMGNLGGLTVGKVNRFRVKSGSVDIAVFLNQ